MAITVPVRVGAVVTLTGVPLSSGAAAGLSAEHLVAQRVDDDADEWLIPIEQRHGDTDVGDPVDEVDGAVERIDDPAPPTSRGGPTFLGEDGIVGAVAAQVAEDHLLGGTVDFGDRIVEGLEFGGSEVTEPFADDGGSGGGRMNGEFQILHRATLCRQVACPAAGLTCVRSWPRTHTPF